MIPRLFSILFLLLANCPALVAATWYAAPDASATGDGSLQNPWALQIALTNSASIQPGDNLYLRGGTYRGPFVSALSGTANNYVIIRSHPGEWAVITDPLPVTLLTNLPATSATVGNVPISGTELWPSVGDVIAGTERMYLYVKNGTNWSVDRAQSGTTATTHTAGDQMLSPANLLTHNGSYVRFMDFEITSARGTNRIVNATNTIGAGLVLSAVGHANKAVNLIVHNVGHPGIGFWNQGDGGEINGCVMWGIGMYDNEGTWIRGTSVYAQNSTATVYLKNNIVFRCFTEGMQGYGEGASVSGFRFINNITMANGNGYGIAVWHESLPVSDNATWTNYHGMDGEVWSYLSVANRNASIVGNVLVNPPLFQIGSYLSGVMSNNTFLFDGNATGTANGMLRFDYPTTNRAAISLLIDRNQYKVKNFADADPFSVRTSDINATNSTGGSRVKWTDGTNSWSAWTGWDTNSTYASSWPTDYSNVVAQVSEYDPNRWHICVINTTSATNATLDLSGLGFTSGQPYELRDAQNYFNLITNGNWTAGSIVLPLWQTNVASIPGVTNFVNKHTNVDEPGLFNAFVLRRLPRLAPPGFLHVQPPP